MGLKIIGTGSMLPKKLVTNDELSAIVDTSDDWIAARTGIKSRYICTTENLTDLAEGAARAALEKTKFTAKDIEMIICPTLGGDFVFPSLACCLAERLGVKCPAVDINAACSGFVYGLEMAEGLLATGRYENILIVSADIMSRLLDWSDRATCVLFGDGAGACMVTTGNAIKYLRTTTDPKTGMLYAKAKNKNNPFVIHLPENEYVHMQGQDVYEFAVRAVTKEILTALSAINMDASNVRYFILHQANNRIIDAVRMRIKQPSEKFPVNIDRCANTTAATIPILLDEMAVSQKIKAGDVLVMVGFGAGMTTGTCIMIWE